MKQCQHGMTIYEGPNSEDIYSCAYCNPPEEIVIRKRMTGYLANIDNFCTDETVELLMSSNVVINFYVPEWAEGDFSDDYHRCAGDLPDFESSGVNRSSAKTREDKRWYSASIEFDWNDEFTFADQYLNRIKESRSANRAKIYCIHFAGFLLAQGFKQGRN